MGAVTKQGTVFVLITLFNSLLAQTCTSVTSVGIADPKVFPSSGIVVSSELQGHGKEELRYNCCQGTDGVAWCPDPSDLNPYVEIHFDKKVVVGQIDIQPPTLKDKTSYPTNFMKTFDLLFNQSALGELFYVSQNISAISNKTVYLSSISVDPPVYTDVIRIVPNTFENSPCFRLELYTCEVKSLCPAGFCENNGNCSGPNTCECPAAYFGAKCQYTKQTIPITAYTFLRIVSNTIITSAETLTFSGNVTLDSQNSLLIQSGSYINLGGFSSTPCFRDLDSCFSGFTIQVSFRVSVLDSNPLFVLSNGDQSGMSPTVQGITLLFRDTEIHCYLVTATRIWTIVKPFTPVESRWYEMTISWGPETGLILLQGNSLIDLALRPQTLPVKATQINSLAIGCPVRTTLADLFFKSVITVPLYWGELKKAGLELASTTVATSAKPAITTPIRVGTSTPLVTSTLTSTPAVTSKPAVTATPGKTSTPAITSTPDVTSTPAVTSTPGRTSTPGITSTPSTTTVVFTSTTSTVSQGPVCNKELGMRDGTIKPSQIIASSSQKGHETEMARAGCCKGQEDGAWCAEATDDFPWIQVTFPNATTVSGIEFQLPETTSVSVIPASFVEIVMVKFRDVNSGSSELEVYRESVRATYNATVAYTVTLEPLLVTDTVRFYISKYVGNACLRFELLGCRLSDVCQPNLCENGGKCTGENTCLCTDDYYGEQCQLKKQQIDFPEIGFQTIINNTITTTITNINLAVIGNVSLIKDFNINVIQLVNGGLVKFPEDKCLQILDKCNSGFTISLKINVRTISDDNILIITNGGHKNDTQGLSLVYNRIEKKLTFTVTTRNYYWTVSTKFELEEKIWEKITLSWSPFKGIKLAINDILVGSVIGGIKSVIGDKTDVLCIGCSFENFKVTSTILIKSIIKVPVFITDLIRAGLINITSTPVIDTKIVEHFWDLTNITQASTISHNWKLVLVGNPTNKTDGIVLGDTNQRLEIPNLSSSCLFNPILCTTGFTIRLTIKFSVLEEGTVIFTTGGESTDKTGVTLLYRYGYIHAIVSTIDLSWYVSVPRNIIKINSLSDIIVSWSLNTKLKLIINQDLVEISDLPVPHANITLPVTSTLTIGGGVTRGIVSRIHIWLTNVDVLLNLRIISCSCNEKTTTTSLSTTQLPVTVALTNATTPATTAGRPPTSAARPATTAETVTRQTTPQCPVGCVPSSTCTTQPAPTTPKPSEEACVEETTPPANGESPTPKPPTPPANGGTTEEVCEESTPTPAPTNGQATTPKPSSQPVTSTNAPTPKPSSQPVTSTNAPTPRPSSQPESSTNAPTPPKSTAAPPVPTTAQPTNPQTTTSRTTSTTRTTTTTRASTTIKPSCPQPPSSVTLIPEVSVNGRGQLTCSLARAPEVGTAVRFTWRIEGESVTWNKVIESPDRSATISVTEIKISILNKRITCTAEVRYLVAQAEWCWPVGSNVVVPAITCPPLNGTIKVIEGQEHQYLQVQTTVPPSLLCRPEDNGQCRVEVTTSIVTTLLNEIKCSLTEIIPQAVLGVTTVGQGPSLSCGLPITSGNWQNGVTIPIKATVDGVKDGNRNRKLRVSVRIVGQISLGTITNNCGEVDIVVVDRDEVATCSSVNDPHLTSFDTVRYNNFMAGEFVMYNHTTLQQEVRASYKPCSAKQPKGPTCNCGAAVRSGDDVIVFDTCDTRANQITSIGNSIITVTMYKNGQLTPGTRVIRNGCGQKYEVYLPTGTKVTITATKKPFMNINIQASTYDFERTEGLCGSYNKIPSDDLHPFTPKTSDSFSKLWKRETTIFKGVSAIATSVQPTYCSCQSGYPPVCQQGLDIYLCRGGSLLTGDITAILVSQAKTPTVLSQNIVQINQIKGRGRRDADIPSSQSFTEEEATQYCRNYLENNQAVKNCADHLKVDAVNASIVSCAEDLMALNDTDWATSHVDHLVTECLAGVMTNASTWDNNPNPDGPFLPDNIISDLCTQKCSQYGTCVKGICECESGWTGETCDVGISTVPTVLSASEPCDLIASSCTDISVEGNNFLDTDTLTCKIRYLKIGNEVSITGEDYTVPAKFISLGQVVCPQRVGLSQQGRSALVTVSNDGVSYSDNSFYHVVYKSTCQTCSSPDSLQDIKCNWKSGSCVIDNQCYARSELYDQDNCYICNPDVNAEKWTRTSTPNCTVTPEKVVLADDSSGSDDTAIIVLGVLCGVMALAVVGVIIGIFKVRASRNSKLRDLSDRERNSNGRSAVTASSSSDLIAEDQAATRNAFYNPTYPS